MKKKLLTSLIVGASIITAPNLAYATENTDSLDPQPEVVEQQESVNQEVVKPQVVAPEVIKPEVEKPIEQVSNNNTSSVDTVDKDENSTVKEDVTSSNDEKNDILEDSSNVSDTNSNVSENVSDTTLDINSSTNNSTTITTESSSSDKNLTVTAKETNDNALSEGAHSALTYAIEEMRIAITRLSNEGMTPLNFEYILKFGSTSIERIRPFYNELISNSQSVGHVSFINESWTLISNAYAKFTVAGDGTSNDNIMTDGEIQDGSSDDNFAVLDSIKALEDAHCEVLVALDRFEKEGMTPDNYKYIMQFGATAIERIRPFYDELLATGDKEVLAMIETINSIYSQLLSAYNNFTVAGDGTSNDNIMTDGEIQDGSSDDNFLVPPFTVGDGTADDNIMTDGEIQDGSFDDNFVVLDSIKALQDAHYEITVALDRLNNEGMTPLNYKYIMQFGATAIERLRPFFDELVATGDPEVLAMIAAINDGYTTILNAYNNFTVAGDGTVDDNIMTDGEIQDGSSDDNFLVPPTVEDGSADDDMMVDAENESNNNDNNNNNNNNNNDNNNSSNTNSNNNNSGNGSTGSKNQNTTDKKSNTLAASPASVPRTGDTGILGALLGVFSSLGLGLGFKKF